MDPYQKKAVAAVLGFLVLVACGSPPKPIRNQGYSEAQARTNGDSTSPTTDAPQTTDETENEIDLENLLAIHETEKAILETEIEDSLSFVNAVRVQEEQGLGNSDPSSTPSLDISRLSKLGGIDLSGLFAAIESGDINVIADALMIVINNLKAMLIELETKINDLQNLIAAQA